jgi:nucleotide-binding universal stress UspA family protein
MKTRTSARPSVITLVLHPTDFSAASRPAFAEAVRLARSARAELLLLHGVMPVIQIPELYVASTQTYDTFQRAVRARARRQLERLVARARAAGVRVSGSFVHGLPHEQIVRAARARRASVIVMGTHGRTGMARVVLGSVAARVLLAAPCPVLTVRRPPAAARAAA